jgi:hypothetical protein
MTVNKKNEVAQIVMLVLDQLSERYFIHRPPVIRKSDNLTLGWGNKRKTSINFAFVTEKPNRKEIETEVKLILENLL